RPGRDLARHADRALARLQQKPGAHLEASAFQWTARSPAARHAHGHTGGARGPASRAKDRRAIAPQVVSNGARSRSGAENGQRAATFLAVRLGAAAAASAARSMLRVEP